MRWFNCGSNNYFPRNCSIKFQTHQKRKQITCLPKKHITVSSHNKFGWIIDPSMLWASGNKVAISPLRNQLYPQPLTSLETLLHFWPSPIIPTTQHFIGWGESSWLELTLLGFRWLFDLILHDPSLPTFSMHLAHLWNKHTCLKEK